MAAECHHYDRYATRLSVRLRNASDAQRRHDILDVLNHEPTPTAEYSMHHRYFQLFLLFSVLLSCVIPSFADDRPNIVWIIADDLSQDLSCYGYEGVNTPNIDRLAEQGARYTRAFSTSPVCSTSRSAFITGVYQTTTETHQHRTTFKKPLAPPIEPITQLFRRAGYYVSNSNSAMTRAGKKDYNFAVDGDLYDAPDWSARKKGQPFFAQVQIHEPHRSFVQAQDINRADGVQIPSYYPDHPVIRADWANYLETVEVLDDKVGNVLDRLRNEGELENTIVMFFGDHGRPHYRDKQWLYDGGILVPLIVRWPGKIPQGEVRDLMVSLIDVAATSLRAAGIVIPEWMDGQDMLNQSFDGRELIFAARDRCGSTIDRIRCVRSEQFKYIRNFYPDRPYTQHSGYKELQYPGMTLGHVLNQRGELYGPPSLFWADSRPAEELYDLVADPEELNNLADDEGHQPTRKRMSGELDQWMTQTGDKGASAEDKLQETVNASDQWYQKSMTKRGFDLDFDREDYLKWWESKLGVQP